MTSSFAEELYSESLQSTKSESGYNLASDFKQNQSSGSEVDNLRQDGGSFWGGSDEDLEEISDMDREWQRRHDQFHTIGYRDGLIAGKEASAQEGFNIGFKQSISVGYNWGLVRGVSSVLACLPSDLKEKLVESEAKRNKFQGLYESVHSISTADALSLFNDDLTARGGAEDRANANASTQVIDLSKQNLDYGRLGEYYRELQGLLLELPALDIHLREEQ